MSLYFEFLL